MNKDLVVFNHYGVASFVINERFINAHNAWKNLEKIKEVYQLKLLFYEMISEALQVNEPVKWLASNITECEFELQRLYGVKEDINYHRFWETPGCTCAKWDNQDNYPCGCYIISEDCPLHGSLK